MRSGTIVGSYKCPHPVQRVSTVLHTRLEAAHDDCVKHAISTAAVNDVKKYLKDTFLTTCLGKSLGIQNK